MRTVGSVIGDMVITGEDGCLVLDRVGAVVGYG